MLQYKWNSTTIRTNSAANEMIAKIKELNPKIGAFDTETDGLHIVLNKPFVVQFGFLHPTEEIGYTYAVDLEKMPELAQQTIKAFLKLAKNFDKLLGHNVKFDLHMLKNKGIKYTTENLSDTMFYIRYAHDALQPAAGGPPLGLKEYVTRHVDHKAKVHEKALKQEQTAIASEYNLKLKQRLAKCGKPMNKYATKSYTLAVIKDIFKDPTFQISDLPEAIQQAYLDWLQLDLPLYLQNKVTALVERNMIPYTILNRNNLLKYAHYDIIYTLETYLLTNPIIQYRGNQVGIDLEDSLILPLFEMERVGFSCDKDYLIDSEERVRNYIRLRREKLYDILEEEIQIGQHAKIKKIIQTKFGIILNSTGVEELDLLKSETEDEQLYELIELIQELRTLEKWYSAYIVRFLKDIKYTDRLYTTINQIGAVSGRVTSDFQQFPRQAIKTIDGEELFYPRKMIKVTGGDYHALIYLDYSQIELRFQAMYTILVGHPDLNLCRAYMPYNCVDSNGESFNCYNPKHIVKWHEPWFLKENPEEQWSPVDVHGATTTAATGLTPNDPTFHEERTHIGKAVNFAKNYGAQLSRIRIMFPQKTEEEVRRIDAAYYTAFPGVKYYHDYCYNRATCNYTTNLFGVKYYNVSGHKLINLLIQGSAAYFLKIKIRELYEFSKANNLKSRWQMNIHDELSWEKHKDEDEVFFKFKEIMEAWPDTLVPIVAEMAITTNTWADKEEVKTLDELQIYLSN